MNFDALFFSFYLLFPSFNSYQADLISTVTGPLSLTQEAKEDVCREIKNFLSLYDYSDLFEINLPSALDGETDEGKNLVEVQYFDSQKRLRLFEFDDEIFCPQEVFTLGPSIVKVNKDSFSVSLYDELYRLKEKVLWKNASTSAAAVMLNRKTFAYSKQVEKENKISPISMVEEDFKNKETIKVLYDEKGNPFSFSYYKNEGEEGEKNILFKKRNCRYNEEKKLLEEEEIVYFKVSDPLRRGKKKDAQASRKNVFSYTEKSSFPDYDFYEDGKLRMKVSYSDEEDYTEEVFFEEGISVKSFFENGIKVEEIIYKDNNEENRRVF